MNFSGSTSNPGGHTPLRPTMVLLALAFALAGCDTGFVDPNPPELVTLTRTQEIALQEEPTVYGIVLDLHFSDGAECVRTREQIVSTVQTAFAPPDRRYPAVRLTLQDLAPGCQQSPNRRLDVAQLEAEVEAARQRFPDRVVRPILLYFNNVNLPLPADLIADFEAARAQLAEQGDAEPFLWALTTDDVFSSVHFDESFSWTFSTDTTLLAGLTGAAQKQLPMVSHVPLPASLPLFDEDELEWAAEVKGCRVNPRVHGVNVELQGTANEVDPSSPPTYRIEGLSLVPLPKNRISAEVITFDLEVCLRNCDRLYVLPHGLEVWRANPFCFLGENR
jgi:hypothetical protein